MTDYGNWRSETTLWARLDAFHAAFLLLFVRDVLIVKLPSYRHAHAQQYITAYKNTIIRMLETVCGWDYASTI